MAYQFKNRIRGTTATTGTGAYTVLAAPTGFQGFDQITSGRQVHYAAVLGANWEVGIGTVTISGSTVLSRDTILASSNSGSAVNWTSGVKEVFVAPSAQALEALWFDGTDRQGDFSGTLRVTKGFTAQLGMNVASAVGGTADAITATLAPAIAAYGNGMQVTLVPGSANTGAATLAVNGLTARSIVKDNAVALVANDILAGIPIVVVYDLANTRWVLQGPQKVTDGRLSSNLPLKNASNTFTQNFGAIDGAPIVLSSTSPYVQFTQSNAAANNGKWGLGASSEAFQGVAYNDAGSGVNWLTVDRTENTVDSIAFAATAITVNGVNVTDFARQSQANTFLAAQGITVDDDVAAIDLRGATSGRFRVIPWETGSSGTWIQSLNTDGSAFVPLSVSALSFTLSAASGLVIEANLTTPNTSASEVGFKGTPQNTQNGDYTLVLADAGKAIYKASGGAGETITIPANGSVAFPVGTRIKVVNNGGGTLALAVTTDTLRLAGNGSVGSRFIPAYGVADLHKVASTEWFVSGEGLIGPLNGEHISSSVTFGGDGLMVGVPSVVHLYPDAWYSKYTPGIGDDYYLKVTKTSGVGNFDGYSTFTLISSLGAVVGYTGAPGFANGTWEISADSGGTNIVATGTITVGNAF